MLEHGGTDLGPAVAWDFSTNANPLPPPESLSMALAGADRRRYPEPSYLHLRECLAARGIACGMKLKVTDVRRIRRGRVTRRRRDADSLYQRIGRRVHARVGAFVRIVIGSRPICSPHGARVAHNALKSDAAPQAKSHRHAGDPRQLRPTRRAESQVTHPVHP